MNMKEAIELSAQCWSDPKTSNRIMDEVLAKVFAEKLYRAYIEGQADGLKTAILKA